MSIKFLFCLLPVFVFCEQVIIPGRLTVKHMEMDGVGFQGGYSTIQAQLAAPFSMRNIPFADVRYHISNQGFSGLNGGLGYRYNTGSVLFGLNAYYDARWTSGQTFSQFGGGVELLARFIDFRFNGYFPINKSKEERSVSFGGFQGNGANLKIKDRLALTGGDGEVGACIADLGEMKFYLAGGSYYFKRQSCNTKIGAKGRLRFSWRDTIWAQFSVTHDSLYQTNYQGTVSFSYPAWPKPKRHRWSSFPSEEAMMVQPVERLEWIVLCDHTRFEPIPNQLIYFVDNTSNSLGTFESPFPTLVQAQNASGPGDIIYVFSGNETSQGMSDGITLQNGQRLLGSGTDYSINTPCGTFVIPAQTAANPIITNTGGNAINLALDNTVHGFNIEMPSGDTINGSAIGNTTIEQIVAAGALAITTNGGSQNSLTIRNCAFSGTGTLSAIDSSRLNVGIEGSAFSSILALTNSDTSALFAGMRNSRAGGILSLFGGKTGDLIIDQCTSNSGIGIFVTNTATSVNAGVTNSAVQGSITANVTGSGSGASAQVLIEQNTIAANGSSGVLTTCGEGSLMLGVNENTITGATNGILITPATNGALTFNAFNNTITSPSVDGIAITSAAVSNFTLTSILKDNTVTGAAGKGFNVNGAAGVTYEFALTGNRFTSADNGFNISLTDTASCTLTATSHVVLSTGTAGVNLSTTDTSNLQVTLDNFTLLNNGAEGVLGTATGTSTLTATISNSTIADGTDGIVWDITDATSTLDVDSVNILAPGNNGVSTTVDAGTLTATIQNCTIPSSANGLLITPAAAGTLNLTVSNNAITNPTTNAILVLATTAPGFSWTGVFNQNNIFTGNSAAITINGRGGVIYDLTFTGNTVSGSGAGFTGLVGMAIADSASYTVDVNGGNSFSSSFIIINDSSIAPTTATVDANISDSTFSGNSDIGLAIQLDGSGAHQVSIDNITVTGGLTDPLGIEAIGTGCATVSLTNNNLGNSTTIESSIAVNTGDLCLTLTGNSPITYALDNSAGTFSVISSGNTTTDVASQNASGTVVTNMGTITAVTSCPSCP